MITGAINYNAVSKTTNNISSMTDADFKKDEFINGETNFCLDYFCEETRTRRGIKSNFRYYLVPMPNAEKFLVVKASEKYFTLLDSMCEATDKYLSDDTESTPEPTMQLQVAGKLKTYDSEVTQYLVSYFSEGDQSAYYADYVFPYYVNAGEQDNYKGYIYFGAGAILFGLIIVAIGSIKR